MHALLATAACEATGTKRLAYGPLLLPRGSGAICEHQCGGDARLSDTVNTCCAAGHNLRRLLRAIARLGIGAVFLRLLQAVLSQRRTTGSSYGTLGRSWMTSVRNWIGSVMVKKSVFGHAVGGVF